jgi:hypothetical protein
MWLRLRRRPEIDRKLGRVSRHRRSVGREHERSQGRNAAAHPFRRGGSFRGVSALRRNRAEGNTADPPIALEGLVLTQRRASARFSDASQPFTLRALNSHA